jgi:carboxymethylenebutenolidase
MTRKPKKAPRRSGLAKAEESLSQLWEEHVRHEFATHNTEDTLATMVEDAYVNHIPVLTGGVGRDELREFYSKRFIPQMPPDTEMVPISRTIGNNQLVDEMVFKFTHTIRMDWMLPGIAPTGKRVEVPLVAIVQFRDGKLAHEHIYWDQASVLVQLGLLDAGTLPVAGVETARKALNPNLPSNALMRRAATDLTMCDPFETYNERSRQILAQTAAGHKPRRPRMTETE